MIRAARALYPPLIRALALVHGAALGLLSLVVAVEHHGAGAAAMLAQVLPLWARLSPALTPLGCALAAYRMRSTLLTLGTLGLHDGALALAALPLGGGIGGLTLAVPQRATSSAWVRGVDGWFHLGHAVPDLPGAGVVAIPAPIAWSVLLACLLAAPLGARRWTPGPLAVVIVASILGEAAIEWGGVFVLLASAAVRGTVGRVTLRYSQPRRGAV